MRSTTTNTASTTTATTIHIQASAADPLPCRIAGCQGDRYPGLECSDADRHAEIEAENEARHEEKVAQFCSIAGCTRPPYAASHEGVRPDRYTGTVCAKHYDDVVDGRICSDCGQAHEEGQTPLCEFDF